MLILGLTLGAIPPSFFLVFPAEPPFRSLCRLRGGVPSFCVYYARWYPASCFFLGSYAMENCLDLAIRTGGAAGSDAPTQTLIRHLRSLFPGIRCRLSLRPLSGILCRHFRRTGRPAGTLVYKSHPRVGVYNFYGKGVRPSAWSTLCLLYSSNFGAKIGIKNESQISGLVSE